MALQHPPRPHDPLLRALRRHPFLIGSVALHAAALWALSQWQDHAFANAELRVNQGRIQAHTQAAEQQGVRRRMDSLKAMKALAERIERSQAGSEATPDEAPRPAPAASAAADPQALLAQARELRDSIQRLEQQAQARQMAELLKLSPEEALAKVKQQAAEAAKREAAADVATAAAGGEPVMQALNRYEQQAQEALERLQAQQARQQQGTSVQHAAGAGQGAGAGAAGGAGAGAGGGAGMQAGRGGGQGSAGDGTGVGDGRRAGIAGEAPRVYDGVQRTPAVDDGRLRLGSGNALGAGGAWANRVHVDRWYLIGPFHAPNAEAMNRLYPPEQWVDLDGVYLGKGRRVLRWQYVSSAAYPLMPPDEAEQAIYYGYAELRSDRARTVWLGLGADDDAKLWLNDRLVWISGNQRKAWYTDGGVQSLKEDIRKRNLIEQRVRVTLRPGLNTVLFKLYNNPLDVFFSLVIEPMPEGG
ncbi:MAG: hypothetical protein JNM33_12770 [Rubrivivax sp.]|nr:hypothetical protein [Rubrivivax sp.]